MEGIGRGKKNGESRKMESEKITEYEEMKRMKEKRLAGILEKRAEGMCNERKKEGDERKGERKKLESVNEAKYEESERMKGKKC